MKHTEKDIEKLASALNRFSGRLNKEFLWREQKAAYKSLALLTSSDFVAELNKEKNNWRRNVKLRHKLSEYWGGLVKAGRINDAFAITRWLVKEWGGIKRIRDDTINQHFWDAINQKYSLPFDKISSKSKVFALANPDALQIYDARVAVSLNSIQLAANTDVRIYFTIPETRIKSIQFNDDCFQARLPQGAFEEFDFVSITLDSIYSAYIELVNRLALRMSVSPVDVEMRLFGLAFDFCENPKTLSDILSEERRRRRANAIK